MQEIKKKRIIIFGAGGSGRQLLDEYQMNKAVEVIAFADNYKEGYVSGLPILKPYDICTVDFDTIIITTVNNATIKSQLLDLGISSTKIQNSILSELAAARISFLKRFAEEVQRKCLPGETAEAGVFQGEFASKINEYFPEKNLYLFDTFTGFDERDIKFEEGYEQDPHRGDHFINTSVSLVLAKMKFPQNCIIRQGYVPNTLQGLEDKRFCFVNLDMDLYQPTLSALEWFWPRMTSGGVILIHDYFDDTGTYPNLKKAVMKYTSENNILSIPIGDDLSIALLKS